MSTQIRLVSALNFRDIVVTEAHKLETKVRNICDNFATTEHLKQAEDKYCVGFLGKIFRFIREELRQDDIDKIKQVFTEQADHHIELAQQKHTAHKNQLDQIQAAIATLSQQVSGKTQQSNFSTNSSKARLPPLSRKSSQIEITHEIDNQTDNNKYNGSGSNSLMAPNQASSLLIQNSNNSGTLSNPSTSIMNSNTTESGAGTTSSQALRLINSTKEIQRSVEQSIRDAIDCPQSALHMKMNKMLQGLNEVKNIQHITMTEEQKQKIVTKTQPGSARSIGQLLEMSMKRFGVPQNIQLANFKRRACQHMSHANGYLLVNNSDNNISVYKLDQNEIRTPALATKVDAKKELNMQGLTRRRSTKHYMKQDIDVSNKPKNGDPVRHQNLHTIIELKGKGMVCSLVSGDSIFIGCRDGTLAQISLKDFEIQRELITDCPISTIAEVTPELLAVGSTQGSGWCDNRGQISIIRLVKTETSAKKLEKIQTMGHNGQYGGFKLEGVTMLAIGDINKIIINNQGNNIVELILACQNGIYFATLDLKSGNTKAAGGSQTKLSNTEKAKQGFLSVFKFTSPKNQKNINLDSSEQEEIDYPQTQNRKKSPFNFFQRGSNKIDQIKAEADIFKEKQQTMFVELTSESYLVNQRISQVAFVDASINAPDPNSQNDDTQMRQITRSSATSKLLVAIWNQQGYRLIERNPYVLKPQEKEQLEEQQSDQEQEDLKVKEVKLEGILIHDPKISFKCQGTFQTKPCPSVFTFKSFDKIKSEQMKCWKCGSSICLKCKQLSHEGICTIQEQPKGKFCTDLHPLAPVLFPNLFVSRTNNELNLIDVSLGKIFVMVNDHANPIQKFQKLGIVDFGEWEDLDIARKAKKGGKIMSQATLNKVQIGLIYITEHTKTSTEETILPPKPEEDENDNVSSSGLLPHSQDKIRVQKSFQKNLSQDNLRIDPNQSYLSQPGAKAQTTHNAGQEALDKKNKEKYQLKPTISVTKFSGVSVVQFNLTKRFFQVFPSFAQQQATAVDKDDTQKLEEDELNNTSNLDLTTPVRLSRKKVFLKKSATVAMLPSQAQLQQISEKHSAFDERTDLQNSFDGRNNNIVPENTALTEVREEFHLPKIQVLEGSFDK